MEYYVMAINTEGERVNIIPDIVGTIRDPNKPDSLRMMALELECDKDWDFGASFR